MSARNNKKSLMTARGDTLQTVTGQFTGAVDLTWEPLTQGFYHGVMIAFDAAPTTAEDITATITSPVDSAYDTELETVDPNGETDAILDNYAPWAVPRGHGIKVEYPNTDGNTISVTIIGAERVPY